MYMTLLFVVDDPVPVVLGRHLGFGEAECNFLKIRFWLQ